MTSRQNFVTPYLISLLLPDLELFRCKDLVLEIAATWHSLMKYKNTTLVYKVVPGSYKNTIKIKKINTSCFMTLRQVYCTFHYYQDNQITIKNLNLMQPNQTEI